MNPPGAHADDSKGGKFRIGLLFEFPVPDPLFDHAGEASFQLRPFLPDVCKFFSFDIFEFLKKNREIFLVLVQAAPQHQVQQPEFLPAGCSLTVQDFEGIPQFIFDELVMNQI